jgi:hypothetical protein
MGLLIIAHPLKLDIGVKLWIKHNKLCITLKSYPYKNSKQKRMQLTKCG